MATPTEIAIEKARYALTQALLNMPDAAKREVFVQVIDDLNRKIQAIDDDEKRREAQRKAAETPAPETTPGSEGL